MLSARSIGQTIIALGYVSGAPTRGCRRIAFVITATQQEIKELYHYQGSNIDWLKGTLINNHVHVSNPKNFNDPWDCRPYFDPATVSDPASFTKWRELSEKWLGELPPDDRSYIEQRLGPERRSDQDLVVRIINSITAVVPKIIEERWRIYCLTTHPDSVLMWSHYADKHSGLCLQFDATEYPAGRAYQVLYRKELPALGPDIFTADKGMAEAVLLTKAIAWRYEDEYRILGRDESFDPAFSIVTKDDSIVLPPGSLKAVIVGCNAKLEPIRQLVREYAPGLAIRQAVRQPHKYKLEIIDVEPT